MVTPFAFAQAFLSTTTGSKFTACAPYRNVSCEVTTDPVTTHQYETKYGMVGGGGGGGAERQCLQVKDEMK